MSGKINLFNRIALVAISCALVFAATGCFFVKVVRGSGDLASRDFPVDSFDRVELDGEWDATIKYADTHRVAVHIDDNLMEHVRVTTSGSTVEIDFENSINVSSKNPLSVSIETPELSGVALDGATTAVIDGFEGAQFTFDLDGSSDLIADVDTELLILKVDGASNVNIAGTATEVRIDSDGSSDLDLAQLISTEARLSLDGATTLDVRGAAQVSGDADGATDIIVGTDTKLDVDLDGASSVERR